MFPVRYYLQLFIGSAADPLAGTICKLSLVLLLSFGLVLSERQHLKRCFLHLFWHCRLQVIISNAIILWPGGRFKSYYILLLRIFGSIDRNIGIKHAQGGAAPKDLIQNLL
ncbi:hypothetical protein PS6_009739 [Mucor atramentarius]